MAKQVEFPPGQRHSAGFERACLVLAVVLAVVVLIINNSESRRPASARRPGRRILPSCACGNPPSRGSPPEPWQRWARWCSPTSRRRRSTRRSPGGRRRRVDLPAVAGGIVIQPGRPSSWRSCRRPAAPARTPLSSSCGWRDEASPWRDRPVRADDDSLTSFATGPLAGTVPLARDDRFTSAAYKVSAFPTVTSSTLPAGSPTPGSATSPGPIRRGDHLARELHDLAVRGVDEHRRVQLQRAIRLPRRQRHGPVRSLLHPVRRNRTTSWSASMPAAFSAIAIAWR